MEYDEYEDITTTEADTLDASAQPRVDVLALVIMKSGGIMEVTRGDPASQRILSYQTHLARQGYTILSEVLGWGYATHRIKYESEDGYPIMALARIHSPK